MTDLACGYDIYECSMEILPTWQFVSGVLVYILLCIALVVLLSKNIDGK